MRLVDRIRSDLKQALKAKDKTKVHPLRMILSEIDYALATQSKNRDVVSVLMAYLKRLESSLENFPVSEKRVEVIEEIKTLKEYICPKASHLDLDQVIGSLIDRVGAESLNFDSLYSELIADYGEQIDHSIIDSKLRKRLELA